MNKKNIILFLIIIAIISLGFKLYTIDFTVLPLEDVFGWTLLGIANGNGDFTEHTRKTLGWPIFMSPFFNLFDSNDFLDYINTVLDPKSGATTETVDIYKGSEFSAIGQYKLKLKLPSANVALLDSFSAQWLSRPSDFNPNKPIGTGPYKLKKWNRNQSIVLVKNEIIK